MGCCKLAQVDVRKWLNHFFTHIHEYDNDYSRDLIDGTASAQSHAEGHPVTSFEDSPRFLTYSKNLGEPYKILKISPMF